MIFSRRTMAFVLLVFCTVFLFARDIEIIVEDEDLRLPLEGAVVSLRNGQMFVCDEDGKALVSLPDERQAVVQVSYPGYDIQRLTIPAAAGSGIERFSVALRLGGIMVGRELIIEAQRPESSETKSGRSVAISERELARTAEIGIVEDVMNSVKLLPGVGYTGMFRALPSIRGGDPGDLMAVLDGFYLEWPYHWLGSISIFDPKMVSSARLSHGVFSVRYGHTISGLLEVTSKSPSVETELETAIGSSAASLNLSYPINEKGGLLFMGKVTYWDTLVLAAQGLSKVIDNETLDMINAVSTAPYIRSAALALNYRLAPDMEWRLNTFFGSDGVGGDFRTDYDADGIQGRVDAKADYNNYQGFLISSLTTSPISTLALRFTGGIGFHRAVTNDFVNNDITVAYNDDFLENLEKWGLTQQDFLGKYYSAPQANAKVDFERSVFNAQGRVDLDWELGRGFIAAFGVQELYSLWMQDVYTDFLLEVPVARIPDIFKDWLRTQNPGLFPILGPPDYDKAALILPIGYDSNVHNQGFTTSAYGLLEYTSPERFFGAELGLRVDHLYFKGDGFSVQTMPTLSPRLNLDFNVLKNYGWLDSLSLTLGSGLFSSMNTLISFIEGNANIGDYDLKFNRSWTSVIGLKLDMEGYSFNIEGYYKRVFDRAYIIANTAFFPGDNPLGSIFEFESDLFKFDGVGNVWGFDLQLQKMESRYLDGWISYSFNWARYKDPAQGDQGFSNGSTRSTDGWYYPSFHRFHYCNVVLNIKPLNWFHIATRFGFASGQPRNKVDDTIYSYPVQAVDETGEPLCDDNGKPVIIQKYRRDSWYDENERTAWSLPLDLKFSFFLKDRKGRVNTEIYFAAENLASLIYDPEGNTRFNTFTGKEEAGAGNGNFDLPIPMVSFGFKWRY